MEVGLELEMGGVEMAADIVVLVAALEVEAAAAAAGVPGNDDDDDEEDKPGVSHVLNCFNE